MNQPTQDNKDIRTTDGFQFVYTEHMYQLQLIIDLCTVILYMKWCVQSTAAGMLTMDLALGRYGWMMFSVSGMSPALLCASSAGGPSTTVLTMRMLVSPVHQVGGAMGGALSNGTSTVLWS